MTDFDPFRAATPEPEPRCPKCGWVARQGVSCEACGLIFERYAAAQRRAAAHALVQIEPEASSSSSSASFEHGGDRFGRAAVHAGSLDDVHAGAVVSASMSSTLSTLPTLLGMNIVPAVLGGAVLFMGIAGVAMMTALVASVGVGVAVVLGVVAVFVIARVVAAVSAGTLLVVDEHLRVGDNRGIVAGLTDGWAVGGRVLGVMLVTALIAAGPAVPLGFMVRSASVPVMIGAVLVWGLWLVFSGLRTTLAVPAVVLGGHSVGEAIAESWRGTEGHLWSLVKVGLLGALVAGAITGTAGLLGDNVIGSIIAGVGSIFAGGLYAGVSASLWRAHAG